jgi:FkbM family methyltransferase
LPPNTRVAELALPNPVKSGHLGSAKVQRMSDNGGRPIMRGFASKFVKRQVKKHFWRRGLEIRSSPHLGKFLESRKIDVVLDVGANIGQFGRDLRDEGYRGLIVSFEPVKSVFETLKSVADSDDAWEAHNFALGSTPARTSIKVSESTDFSSLLEQTPEARRFDRSSKVLREEIVEVQRLDDIFSRFKGRRVFLKIDTQGFEREVLEGAQESLKEIFGVQAELPIVHLYRGVWSLPEALAYMSKRGFVLGQVRPTNFDSEERVTLIELDCIFRRERAPAGSPKPTLEAAL